jgi:hypothetical protein
MMTPKPDELTIDSLHVRICYKAETFRQSELLEQLLKDLTGFEGEIHPVVDALVEEMQKRRISLRGQDRLWGVLGALYQRCGHAGLWTYLVGQLPVADNLCRYKLFCATGHPSLEQEMIHMMEKMWMNESGSFDVDRGMIVRALNAHGGAESLKYLRVLQTDMQRELDRLCAVIDAFEEPKKIERTPEQQEEIDLMYAEMFPDEFQWQRDIFEMALGPIGSVGWSQEQQNVLREKRYLKAFFTDLTRNLAQLTERLETANDKPTSK